MESARYGMPSGQPQARFSTQTPQYNVAEAPACVQNAMMTKDKKPFTYTPGGIDLSQIKSQRMAKRLARNAQNEGTTGQQQMNRPNQSPQESSNSGKAQVGSVLGATAMGMPFQVFPTGPPPPPPPPTTKNGAPPPPPPVPKNNLDSISKANTTRGSSVPKNFEPPPLGFRPEIKIPPNPMAALKKVPTPHEKNNFWIEEYRKDHSKSPMREINDFNAQSQTNQDQHEDSYNERPNDAIQNQREQSMPNQRYQDTDFNQQAMKKQSQPNVNKENQITVQLAPINRNQNSQQQQQYAETPRSPQYAQQDRSTSPQNNQSVPWQHVETPRSPQYRPLEHQISQKNTLQQQVETPRSPQYRPLEHQISQKNTLQQQVETPRSPQYQYHPQKEQQLPQKDHQSVPWQHVETPVSPVTPQYISVAPQFIPQEQPTSQKNIQSVPWRTNKHVTPNTDTDFSNKSEVRSSPKPETIQFGIQNQEHKYPGYDGSRDGLNVNKKNIEPQFSKSQIPQRQISINRGDGPSNVPKSSDHMSSPPAPHVFNNGALKKMNEGLRLESISNNPFAKEIIIPIQLEQTPPTSRDQQFNYSKPLLQSGNSNGQSTPSRSTFSPNQFVDQGYNDFSAQPAPITFNKTNNTSNVNTHIIPIAIESNNGGHTVVIQRDPRMKNNSGGECSTPTQSKSFKVLQQITDTSNESGPEIRAVDSEGSDLDTKLHRPTYARQMTTQHVNANSPIILHNNTQIENMYNTPGNSPGTKISHRPFIIQRPVLNSNEQFQHFVRPNATQMAIPNLNFKMLEAMTTAENAAENENSKVIESNNLINEYENDCAYPCLYPHGIPPCCHPSNASNHVYANNLQYISPSYQPLLIQQEQYHHPHHPHHPHSPHQSHQAQHHHSLHHYQYHPCPCCCYYMHSEHGSKNVGCFFRERDRIARSQEPPNVIITSSSDDFATKINENNVRQKRSLSVDDTYSRRVSGNSKMTVTELNRERDNEICCGTLKRFSPQNNLACDESRTSLDTTFENDLTSPSPSSSDNSTTSSFEDCAEQLQISNGALQAAKSVANIQVYNLEDAEDDDQTIGDGESMVFDEEEEEEEEEEDEMLKDEEVEYEEEDLYLDYTNSEGEEQEIYEEDADLSVIYEENEADLASQRPASSNSYCMSESSTLEQSKSSKSEEILLPDEDIEDNSNSVTVRLPLRFSFSRSINDESVATIEVGNSQIDDKDKSLSMADIEPNSEQCDDTDPYDCDVSVTISLSHCSGSEESNATLSSPAASKFDNEIMMKKCIWDSDEEDVVSLTLPSRNHSFDQSKNISVTLPITSPVTHDEIKEVPLPSKLTEENAVDDEEIDFWATLSSGEADKTNYAESSRHNKFEVVKEVSHTSEAKDENIVDKEEDFWATISLLKSNKTHDEEALAESSSHKEEIKEVSYSADAKDEVVEEEDFWATISSHKINKAEAVLESSSHIKHEEIKEVSYTSDAKDENIVEEEEEEEEDFWATISSINSNKTHDEEAVLEIIPHNNHDEIEEACNSVKAKDVETVDEELDFWATLQATRSEAKLFLQKTAGFWGTSSLDANKKNESQSTDIHTPEKSAQTPPITIPEPAKNIPIEPTNIHVPKEIAPTENREGNSLEPEVKKTVKPKKKLTNSENSTTKVKKKKLKQPENPPSDKEMINQKVNVTPQKAAENSKTMELPTEESSTNGKIVEVETKSKTIKIESITEQKIDGNLHSFIKKENLRSKLVSEIAELKAQVMERKFFQSLLIPEKPVPIQAVLSTVECESTTITETTDKKTKTTLISEEISHNTSIKIAETSLEKPNEVEVQKPKKKVIKSKVAEQDKNKPKIKKTLRTATSTKQEDGEEKQKSSKILNSTKSSENIVLKIEKGKQSSLAEENNTQDHNITDFLVEDKAVLASEFKSPIPKKSSKDEEKKAIQTESKPVQRSEISNDEKKKTIQTESKPIQGPEISKSATAGKSKTKTEKKTALDGESKPVQGDAISKAMFAEKSSKTEDSIVRKSSITEDKTSLCVDSQSPQGPKVSKSTIGKKSSTTEEKMAIPTESTPIQISEIFKAPTSAKSSKTDEKISIYTASKPPQVSKISIAPIALDSSKSEENITLPIVSTPAEASEIFKAPTARKSSKTEENITLVTGNIPVQVSEVFKAPIAKKSSKTEKRTVPLPEIKPTGALKDPILKITSGTEEVIATGSATDQASEVFIALNLRKSSKTEESIGMDNKSVKTSETSKLATARKSSKTEESITGNKPVKVKKSSKLSLQNQKSNIPNDMVSSKTQSKSKIESQDSEELLKRKDHFNALKDQLVTFSWSTIDGFNSQYAVTSDVRIEGPLNGCIDYWREKRSPSPTYKNPNYTNDESEGIDFRLKIKSSDSGTRKAISLETEPQFSDTHSSPALKEKTKEPKEKSKTKLLRSNKSSTLIKNDDALQTEPPTESKKSSKSTSDPQSSKKKDSTLIKDLAKIKKFAKKIKSESENVSLGDISTENDALFRNKPRSGSVSENVITKTVPVGPNPIKQQPRSLASSCNFHLYNDNDVQFLYFNSQPSYFPVQNEPTRVPMIGTVDFWSVQEKFEPNIEIYMNNSPIEERKCDEPETDFWAEIKGPNTDECEEFVPLTKSESEVCRNNFKKAAAFFTNTISTTKKDEYVAKPKVQKSEEVIAIPKSDESKQDKLPFRSYVSIETDSVLDDKTTKNTVENVKLIENCQQLETREDPITELKLVSSENMTLTVSNQCRPKVFSKQKIASTEQTCDTIPTETKTSVKDRISAKVFLKQNTASTEQTCDTIPTESKTSVKDRISAFESGAIEQPVENANASLVIESPTPVSSLSRNSSQRSESEVEEDDSGVLDMNKPLSETDTESECFPELRKMTRYQRASTHSRLFKLLQDADDVIEEEKTCDEEILEAEFNFRKPKKIVHNVSITRRQNPQALQQAETLIQRRQRLSLPLQRNSIDADNPSSPNSPASPMYDQQASHVSDKLVNELVQSLLLKKSSISLKNLPMEKLQAAAKRVLEEELDSLDNTSLDSTPALTPQDPRNPSYADYYDTWKTKNDPENPANNNNFEILPSRAFKVLQESTATAKRKPWAVLCPRVHSSKTVNSDLSRVTESPESSYRSSPEITSQRASSIGRWRKF